tara:strand:+ start:669 stop:2207 length:1539 start_codon:yes stop_codon:yes gene_type:complete
MGLKKCSAALITSNDFWYHDPETFDEDTKLFNDFGVVKADVADGKKSDEDKLEKCSYYFEIGKEDNHGFKSTNIRFDDKEGFLVVEGEQAPMGKQKQRVFQIGEEARRYKHMGGPRHTVDYIVVSNNKDKQEIQDFIAGMDKSDAEDFGAENLPHINPTIVEGAENIMEAENMNQINPTFVEGSEDIQGAEGCVCNAEGCESCMGAEGLKRDSCCCGATKSKPCLCMEQGVMSCSAKAPMCPCYKVLAEKKGAESLGAESDKYTESELEQMDEDSIQGCLFSIIQENGLEDEYIQRWQDEEEDEDYIWTLVGVVEQYGYKDAIDAIMEIQSAKNAESFEAEQWKPKPPCEECGAVEGGNIDGCDDCNFTYWFNGKVYHPDSMMHIGAESFDADGLHVSGAYVHFDSESDSNTWAVEVQSEQGGSFLADMNTGSILHTSGDFAAEDIQALSAEDISNYLNIAAESQATPHYNMGPDDVVELLQKTSPLPINGWAASAIVVGLSAIVGAKLLNR